MGDTDAERLARKEARAGVKHPDPSTADATLLTTASGKRIKVTDEEFAVMLEKAGGFKSRLAKQLGITVGAVCHRIQRSRYLQETCKTIEETVLDLAEAGLIKAARDGEPWAITFILKCKGRKRGWIERQDVAFAGEADALPPPIVLAVHDAAYIEAERERQKRELAEVVDAAYIELMPQGTDGEQATAGTGGGGADAPAPPDPPETSGATAQPSEADAEDGATVASTEAPSAPDNAKPKQSQAEAKQSQAIEPPVPPEIEVETDVFTDYPDREQPQTAKKAPVARPRKTEAQAQGGAARTPQGAENAPVAQRQQPAPQTPPPRIPRTPSEARAMRLAEEARQRVANGNAAKGQGGSGDRPKPRFFAVPSAFPRR